MKFPEQMTRAAVLGYTDEDYRRILASIPAPTETDLPGLEAGIEGIRRRFAIMAAMEAHVEKDAETRQKLDRLRKASREYEDAMAAMNSGARAEILAAAGTCYADAIAGQKALDDAIQGAASNLEVRKRSGRRRSVAVHQYVDAVILLWETFTGLRAGYQQVPDDVLDYEPPGAKRERGPFLEFAEAVAGPVLGDTFKRSLFVEVLKRHRREEKASG